MINNRVLILGSSGFLGSKLVETAPKKFDIWLADKNQKLQANNKKMISLDLLDYKLVRKILNGIKPRIVIHAARIQPFEENPGKAEIIIGHLVKIIKLISAKLIYISSDAVFDGKKGNYSEYDLPNPITDYGRAKFSAETTIKDKLKEFIIIRTSYIYGQSAGKWDKRTTELLDQIKQDELVCFFNDVYRSPTSVNNLAKACWQLTNKNFSGVIHIADKRKSIFQFNQELLQSLGISNNLLSSNSYKNRGLNIACDTSLDTKLAGIIIGYKPKNITAVCG